MRNSIIFLACACALFTGCKHNASSDIRLNQLGFSPMQEMTATIVLPDSTAEANAVFILNENNDTVWSGVPAVTMKNPISGKSCQIVDFSALDTVGTYTMYLKDGQGKISNVKFQISNRPYRELTRSALRAYYHQRASMATEEPYAEGYARPAGHPDDHVLVHASAATPERPEGTVISSPEGWYDAGDYNKYIVNSGFTMGVLGHFGYSLSHSSASNRQCPDMLSEAMYNIRWMMTMQDLDGGVYHKLTEPDFEGFIRPDQCKKTRYVVMKTTAATLDFAATMAMAARIYAPFDEAFCAQAKEAAVKAYQWALAHPAVYYDQPKMNAQFKPEITTGAYDDFDVNDEFYWAEIELYLLTGDEQYKANIGSHARNIANTLAQDGKYYLPATWGNVAELAYLDLLMHGKTGANALLEHLKPYIDDVETSVFRSPYGNRESDFFWGCNSEGCCWRGIECLYAYRLTGEEKYRINAERCLNYILGQNATGYCYVTGFGTKPTAHPHHRLSYSHPKGTLPGFLAGGPNPAQQDAQTDGVKYPKDVPADESYLDYQPSYASNEVTINWNVTLFALAAGIDALDAQH